MSTISLATLTAPRRGSQRIIPSVKPSRTVRAVFVSARPLSILFRSLGARERLIIARALRAVTVVEQRKDGSCVERDVLSFAVMQP
jgi:hypothetical protein